MAFYGRQIKVKVGDWVRSNDRVQAQALLAQSESARKTDMDADAPWGLRSWFARQWQNERRL